MMVFAVLQMKEVVLSIVKSLLSELSKSVLEDK